MGTKWVEPLITAELQDLNLNAGWQTQSKPVCEGWVQDRKIPVHSDKDMGSLISKSSNEVPHSTGGATGETTGTSSGDHDDMKVKWEREQEELKQQLILHDIGDWCPSSGDPNSHNLHYVGGVDISFIKGDDVNACAALVVLSFPDMKVVYEDLQMIKLTAPYIPGFLAFREVPCLVDMVHYLQTTAPALVPEVILVDGNGILHPREFGLASHLGVLIGIPCIGVAKNLFHVDGLERDDKYKAKENQLKKAGDSFELRGLSGKCLGMALRASDSAPKPIFVSQGHGVSLDTAVWVVEACSKFRIPEPTRQADIKSREYLRQKSPP